MTVQERMTVCTAYCHTRIDFAEPLYTKGCIYLLREILFTCCLTRAVHLELTHDLPLNSFFAVILQISELNRLAYHPNF